MVEANDCVVVNEISGLFDVPRAVRGSRLVGWRIVRPRVRWLVGGCILRWRRMWCALIGGPRTNNLAVRRGFREACSEHDLANLN